MKKIKNINAKKVLGMQKVLLFLVIVIIVTVASLINPNFFQIKNFTAIMQQVAVLGIISMAMLILMIARTIDLSLGAMMGLAGVVMCSMIMNGQNPYLAMVVALVITIFCGALNGVIVTKSKSEPLIITLGMSFIYKGAALVVSDGGFMSLKGNFKGLGGGYFLGIPVPMLVLVLIMLIVSFMLKYTKYGRRLHLIGGNEEFAYLSGVGVDNYKIINYTIAGFITGIGTLVLVARLGNMLAGTGEGYEFRALAAAIIGGVTFEGAKGDVLGTFIGVILLGVVSNAMNLLSISAFYQIAVQGVIIVLAVALSNLSKKKRSKV